ncbi:histone methyltransferase set2 [Coelomomyces lativittatus]|nr:histone methyltransferase set2 [Coelomomyces lativittatus]
MNLSSSLLTSLSTKKDKSSLPSPPMTASSSSFSTTSEPFSSSTTSLLTATTTTTSTSTTTATLPPPPPPPSVLPFSSSFNFIPVSDHLGAAALLSFCSTPSSNLDPSCQTFPSPLHGISNLTTTNRSSSSCSSSSSSSPHLSNLNRKNSSASSSSSSSMSLITPPTSISPFSSPPAWSPHSLIHASTFTHTTTTADTTHPSLERSLESSVPENAMSSLEIKGDQRRSSPLIKKEMDLDKNKETKMETKVPSSSFTPSSSSSSSLLYPTTTLSPLKTNSSSSSLPSNELTASLFTLPSKEEPSLIHLCPKEDSKTLEEEEKVKEDCSLSNSSSLLLAPLKEPAILENPVKKILDSFIHIKTCEYRSKQLGSIVDSGDFPCTCTYDHGRDKLDAACGEGSGCINRQLFIECQPDQCPCGDYCQNRRFQLHDYAPVEVFLTEHKGFGLRTLVDLKPYVDLFFFKFNWYPSLFFFFFFFLKMKMKILLFGLHGSFEFTLFSLFFFFFFF